MSAGYLGLYVFYVLTVVVCTWLYRWQRRRSLVYSMPGTPGKGLGRAPERGRRGLAPSVPFAAPLDLWRPMSSSSSSVYFFYPFSPRSRLHAFAGAGEASPPAACPGSRVPPAPCSFQGDIQEPSRLTSSDAATYPDTRVTPTYANTCTTHVHTRTRSRPLNNTRVPVTPPTGSLP